MSKKETNKLRSITNISRILNTRRVTRKQTAQSGPLVSHNIQLGTTHVTTNTVSYLVTTSISYITVF